METPLFGQAGQSKLGSCWTCKRSTERHSGYMLCKLPSLVPSSLVDIPRLTCPLLPPAYIELLNGPVKSRGWWLDAAGIASSLGCTGWLNC